MASRFHLRQKQTSNNLEIGQGCRRLVGKSVPIQSAGKFNTSIAMH